MICLGHHLGHVWDNIWGILSTTDNNGQQSAVLHASVMHFFKFDHECNRVTHAADESTCLNLNKNYFHHHRQIVITIIIVAIFIIIIDCHHDAQNGGKRRTVGSNKASGGLIMMAKMTKVTRMTKMTKMA